jgi:RNA polymerase sigma-70 factor (sigma-E family)
LNQDGVHAVSMPRDDAFEAWVALNRPRLQKSAFLMCGDWSLGDDLVQEALIRCYPRWERITATGQEPHSYVRKTLVRLVIDHGRRRWRREISVDKVPEQPEPSSPDLSDVIAALNEMPAGQRAVVVLRYWEGLSVTDTANCMGTSEGNVKSQASRGLVALRKALSKANEAREAL